MNQLAALRLGRLGRHFLLALIAAAPTGCGELSNARFPEDSGGNAGTAAAGQAGAGSGGRAGHGGQAGQGGAGSAGQAGRGGAAGQAGSGGSRVEPPFPCAHPAPVLILGEDTGLVQCDRGMLHRARANECPARRRSSDPSPCAGQGNFECSADTDCKAQPLGYCTWANAGVPMCHCQYGCKQDSDCAPGHLCLCGDPSGVCVPSSCKTDDDCGGTYCTQYIQEPYCGGAAFACQTQRDTCATDQDCQSAQSSGACTRETLTSPSACTDELCMFAAPAERP